MDMGLYLNNIGMATGFKDSIEQNTKKKGINRTNNIF
jgi:hypothetical protein